MSAAGATARSSRGPKGAASAFALALLLASAGASAQTIFKCKGADGRYSYSNQPCADGSGALGKRSATAPQAAPAPPPQETESTAQVSTARAALPKQCDNTAMLKAVVTRLDSPAMPDDVRPFLAEERLRLLRCEYVRFAPDEMRTRDAAMTDIAAPDPARRRAAMLRVQALYDRYMTAADRAARAANRQR